MKRFFCILLTLCIVLTLLPFGASAADVSDLSWQIKNGSIEISNCRKDVSGALVIPAEIEGYPVTSIGDGAFGLCQDLTSVSIPDSVTSIGSDIFEQTKLYDDASNWTDGVLYIGSAMIGTRDDITSCIIKDGTRIIADGVFSHRTIGNLTSVTIPASVVSIHETAFEGCSTLVSIEVAAGNPAYRSMDGVLFNQDATTLIRFPREKSGTYQIPSGVTTIGSYAFDNCWDLTSVAIPSSVTSIGDYAFYNCSSLATVTIPDSVASIGDRAFSCCTGLASVTIPDSVTSIGDYAFSGCTGLTSVTIPDSVTSISEGLFHYCTSLTSVTIPDSVTKVGASAFSCCDSLKSVTVPDGVTSIGNWAFERCSLTSVTIPESVTSIGESAFIRCRSLSSVTIPNGVKQIGYRTFCDCKSLTSVTIPNGVTSIGDDAFLWCSSLTSVTIPDSVTSIGDGAFYDCDSLTFATIPNSVTSIGSYAFGGTKLYDDAANWTDGILYIGSVLVAAKDDVTSCKVKADTRLIADGVLNGMNAIEVEKGSRYFSSIDGVLFNQDATTLVCFPSGKSETYRIPEGVTKIGNYAFYNCGGLTEVEIPKEVTEIGDYAFYDCSGLTSVVIPEGVLSIGDYAFAFCAHVENITVPKTVTSIGEGAFDALAFDTEFFESLAIPEGVTELKKDVLQRCYPRTIWLPRSLKVIDEEAFGNAHPGELKGDIYYAGSPEEWAAIEGISNPRISGMIHYHSHLHDLTAVEAVAPTCTEGGTEAYWKCEGCGKLFSDAAGTNEIAAPALVPALGHSWDEGVVTLEPTETAEGVKTFSCTACGETRTEAIPALEPTENPFNDVPDGKFYTDAVLWAVTQEPQITSGYADGTFRPDNTCTRAQVVTFLWRAHGCPEPETAVNPFADVKPTDYYYKAVLWALENNITTGKNATTFDPTGECTRAQVVTFLWRSEGSPEPESSTNPFTDVPNGKYYTKAVLWALEQGITTGRTPTTFNPDGVCTRGHVVTFLYRDMA